MIQILLHNLKMDPLVSLHYYAPVCAIINLFFLPFTEGLEPFYQLKDLGVLVLVSNAAVAFLLNVAAVFLVGVASGLVLTLSGVFKVSCHFCFPPLFLLAAWILTGVTCWFSCIVVSAVNLCSVFIVISSRMIIPAIHKVHDGHPHFYRSPALLCWYGNIRHRLFMSTRTLYVVFHLRSSFPGHHSSFPSLFPMLPHDNGGYMIILRFFAFRSFLRFGDHLPSPLVPSFSLSSFFALYSQDEFLIVPSIYVHPSISRAWVWRNPVLPCNLSKHTTYVSTMASPRVFI